MRTHGGPRIDATILGAASLLALAMGGAAAQTSDQVKSTAPPAVVSEGMSVSDIAGVWTSTNRAIRLEVKPDGRYQRSVVGRDKPASGAYRIDGLSLLLRDDSGLRTNVTIYDDALEMAGHRLHRD
jgi:hypothetical protein